MNNHKVPICHVRDEKGRLIPVYPRVKSKRSIDWFLVCLVIGFVVAIVFNGWAWNRAYGIVIGAHQ